MSEEVEFDRDLFRGTAGDYDRLRVRCPRSLVGDLLERCSPEVGASC